VSTWPSLAPWQIIPFSLVVLAASFVLFRRAAGTMSLRKLNIISWMFYSEILLFTFIGVNLLLLGVPHYMGSRASAGAKLAAYLALCYAMLVMPVTMILAQRYLFGGEIKAKINAYFSQPLRAQWARGDRALVRYWVFISVLALLATVYVYYKQPQAPFLVSLTRDLPTNMFVFLRQEASRRFPGNVYIRGLFSLLLAPFVSYVAYGYHRLYRNKLSLLWFLATMAVAVLALIHSGAKAPILQYLLTLFLIRSYIQGGSRWKELLCIACIIGIMIAILYTVTTDGWTLALNTGPVGRILLSQAAGLPLTFDVFPARHAFLWGGGFPAWICRLLGVEHAQAARILVEIYNPKGVAAGTAGLFVTFFLGDAWANFSWAGLLLSPIWLGLLAQFLHNLLISVPKTPVLVALLGYLTTAFTIASGLMGFIWNPAWYFLFGLVGLGLLLTGNFTPGQSKPSLPRRHKGDPEHGCTALPEA